MGLSGTTFSVVLGVIGRMAAPEKRSLALGIASAGGSFGQFAVLPVGQGLITAFGWQDALLWMAVGIAFIIPLAAAVTGTSERGGGVEQSLRQALAEAMRTPSFHFLFWSFFVCGFQTAFVMLHLPAYVVDMGLSANIGMTAVAMIGLFNIFGSFLSGWLGGLYSKKWLLAWIYALRIVAILALMLFPLSPLTLYVFAAVMGLLWLGTVPLTSGLVGHIFGPALRRHAVRHRLPRPPDRRLPGGLAGRAHLRPQRLVRDGVVAVDRALGDGGGAVAAGARGPARKAGRAMRRGLLRLALVVLAALVLGLLFAAYQQPALLLDFSNLILLCG
jgi:MFS family permease